MVCFGEAVDDQSSLAESMLSCTDTCSGMNAHAQLAHGSEAYVCAHNAAVATCDQQAQHCSYVIVGCSI